METHRESHTILIEMIGFEWNRGVNEGVGTRVDNMSFALCTLSIKLIISTVIILAGQYNNYLIMMNCKTCMFVRG